MYLNCHLFQKQSRTCPKGAHNMVLAGRWGFVHITQCWGLVTNGSNHWILRQPDQVSITDT